ncbi:2OG-Fe(II) oxygenase family protein [Streptomyces sp. AM2-3-1]|uniref:2OG-Fe(II) oxygenase family protein n=1 Tax=Streptomyces sp. AM2-3-1 TaxID=3075824 RepID=UPI0028C49724|nr:2OG-Fe(II) oxygenase family protein [Streptomyces sp. AM2-3-1]WNO67447.1 2OG-Fe(II) oxygenase family protein [Streptomyces sp. AM2-3-1]
MNQDVSIRDGLRSPDSFSAQAAAISPEYLTADALGDLGDWFRTRPTEPKVFRDFLQEDLARSMGEAMRALPVWERYSAVQRDENDPPTAGHFVARSLPDCLADGRMPSQHQKSLRSFLAFSVMSGALQDWIQRGIGVELDRGRTSLELACYRAGDHIEEHQDLLPGRILAINFYLDENYRQGDGARLGYRNEDGREFFVDPLFNSFALVPILPESFHWVEQFEGSSTGRFTVSIGQHRVVRHG